MIAEVLKQNVKEGQAYRHQCPGSTLQDAQDEARRRWPEEPHIGLNRAFFLSGWVQAAFDDPLGEPSEP